MKNKNTTLQIRISPDLKESVEEVLNELGITTSQAINLFLTQIALKKEIPFRISLPKYNDETIRAFEELNLRITEKQPITYSNVEELINDLDR